MKLNAKGKMIIIIIAAVAIALAIIGVSTYFGLTVDRYSGYVYDKETNTPIAGVAVTNGRDVVTTDENGKYVLDGWIKDRFITVTIPSGYWTEDWYIDAKERGTDYNFYLDKQEQDYTEHTFMQVTDTEVGDQGVGPWIEGIKTRVQEEKPAFLVHTGDICYEPGLKSHYAGMNTETMGVPVRYVIGNHDYVQWGGYSEALYESIYGPVCYSFEVGNIHYIVTPFSSGGSDYPPRYNHVDVYKWIANDLKTVADGKKVIVLSHTFCPDEDGYEVKYGVNTLDFKEHDLLAWVFGHWHYNYMYQNDNGIFNISTGRPDSGGIDSSPAVIRTIDIKDTLLTESRMLYYDFKGAKPDDNTVWSTALGGHGEYSEPVVSGNTVYVGTVDDGWNIRESDGKACGIYAIDAVSGDIKWKYDTKNSIRNSIAVSGNKVIAQDIVGNVYCIDAADGTKIWESRVKLTNANNTGFNVLVDGDKVYCGGPQNITCLKINDGSKVWNVERSGATCSPTRMILAGNNLIVGSHWGTLLAYNKNTGKEAWSNDQEGLRFRSTTPAYYNGKLYVAAENKIFELNPSDGKILRKREYLNSDNGALYSFDSATSPYIKDNVGYFATSKDGVVAVDINTFDVKWHFNDIGDSLVFTAPYVGKGSKGVDSSIIELNGDLYFGGLDGYIYRINKNGKQVDKFKLNSPVLSKLAIYDGKIIAMDFSGYISCIEL